jgi:hypothetical protein
MAITRPSKASQLDVFTGAAPDAKPKPRLRGRKQPLALTLPPALIERIDAVAEEDDRSRAKTIERLIIAGLERRNGGGAEA